MVIQRWQSVFLLLATIVIAIFPFYPIFQIGTPTAVYDITPMGLSAQGIPSESVATATPEFSYFAGFIILNVLIVVLTALTIFMYKNIKLQKQLCLIVILLTVFLSAGLCISSYMIMQDLKAMTFSFLSASVLPLLSIISTIMAYSRIKRDERILKSYDRIR